MPRGRLCLAAVSFPRMESAVAVQESGFGCEHHARRTRRAVVYDDAMAWLSLSDDWTEPHSLRALAPHSLFI